MVVPSTEYLMLCLNGILLLDEDSYLCIFSIPDHLRAILLMKSQSRECDDHTSRHTLL